MHRSRAFQALLVGLGVALLVGGLVAPRLLLANARLPLSLGEATWTLTDESGKRQGQPAPVTRQLHMEIRNPSDEDTAAVRVGDTLRAGKAGTDFGNLVTASTWSFALDRETAEVRDPAEVQLVMGMPAEQVLIDAPWLTFPANVEQRAYDVFDPTLRASAPAEFVGEEEIAGRTVYRFRQVIAPVNVAQLYADARNTTYLPGPEGEPQRAFYFHSAERELLVDRISGLVVGINEKVDDFYGDAAGRGIENIVMYDAVMADAQVSQLVQAVSGVAPASRAHTIARIVAALGALLTALGAFLAVRFSRARR